MTDQIRRILSALLVLVMVFTLVPVNARAASAEAVDSVAFFSDLHAHSSDNKTTLVTSIFRSVAANASSNVSAVFSVGDIFSSNNSQNIGSLSAITSAIRTGLGDDSVHVDHVWSDHDRYGGIPNFTGLVYGSGADGAYGTADDGNYYVYFISMSDMTTSPRYGITTTFTASKLTAVQVTVSGNKVTYEVTGDLLWDYSGKKLSYTENGTTRYLYASSSGTWWFSTSTLTLSTTNSSNVSLSSNKIKVGSYYLRYSGGSIQLKSSATTAYLFRETEK